MLLIHFFTFLTGAAAHAASGRDSLGLMMSRAGDVCDGGRDYCGWYDKSANTYPQCQCPRGQTWDISRRSCVYEPIPKPPTTPEEDVYCAANRKNYHKYDAGHELCRGDGRNTVVVAPKGISEADLHSRIDKECKKPRCPSGQVGSGKDKKCKYPEFPKDEADKCSKGGGKPVCARTPKDHCDYDEKKDLCKDDGKNCFECLDKGDPVQQTLEGLFATVDAAVKSLGLGCILGGECSADDQAWADLADPGGLVGTVCSILNRILKIC